MYIASDATATTIEGDTEMFSKCQLAFAMAAAVGIAGADATCLRLPRRPLLMVRS